MSFQEDIKNARILWSDSTLISKLLVGIGVIAASTTLASVSQYVIKWKGAILEAVAFYRSYFSEPLVAWLLQIEIHFPHQAVDITTLLLLSASIFCRAMYFREKSMETQNKKLIAFYVSLVVSTLVVLGAVAFLAKTFNTQVTRFNEINLEIQDIEQRRKNAADSIYRVKKEIEGLHNVGEKVPGYFHDVIKEQYRYLRRAEKLKQEAEESKNRAELLEQELFELKKRIGRQSFFFSISVLVFLILSLSILYSSIGYKAVNRFVSIFWKTDVRLYQQVPGVLLYSLTPITCAFLFLLILAGVNAGLAG